MEFSLHRYTVEEKWDHPLDSAMDSPQTLIVVFVTARPEEELCSELAGIHVSFPNSVVVGCSSSGEIYGEVLSDDSIIAAVIHFADTRLKLVHSEITDAEHSFDVGTSVAEQLLAPDLAAVFTLTDGLKVNGSAYVEGLNHILPDDVIITGGLAGDCDRFERTWLLYDGKCKTGRVVAVGLYGDAVRVAHGSRGGWDLLGPDREVTYSVGNVLYTMDNQPALEVYKKYLGERAEDLPATGLLFPLAIRNENDDDHDTVRTILAVDEQKQSIIFAGDIPEGSHVKLMRANFDRLVDGAAEAAEQLDMTGYENGPAICLAISCVGRRLVLGPRVEEELEAVKEVLPAGAGVIGYYSYGEISPLASGRCDLHNQTMTLTLIWEKA
ncbi:FIST signal transduction protein [Solemya velum gill symbiont]|uniref:Histidine kinase n=1 Tax=Solemya velum gill symbiont TaxID=2340 RepID=A0A0B0HDJ6_SOVGS|nr:FIST N-terminal domain-containing protein [Solemya velum gill symbiont]KHF25516.1 hypothetical protein JV46_20240 [Solemya velum gill symbiont]OOY35348.1 hypothetical protein BOV88_05285 [Solemya velum gill symbiont]OOY38061.1 hypothetical protein BOV89_04265 [Solemya velum gill symbiont]OOY41074.1 hypothetical protein BOV90_00955 [Solemya velum gill symbiont]OOY48187.1 hypothetical protein BOV92_00170 [Solemya velum gill symbiont]